MESSRPKPKNEGDEKGWLETGKDLFNRAVGNEEDAVKKFLEKSKNYKKLKEIVTTSRESREKGGNGIFGGNSIFQRTLYQVSPDEEKMINDLQQAKTFYELLNKLPIKSEIIDSPYGEPLLNKASAIWQEADSARHMIYLIKEIKKFANRNFYSLEPPEPQTRYSRT